MLYGVHVIFMLLYCLREVPKFSPQTGAGLAGQNKEEIQV